MSDETTSGSDDDASKDDAPKPADRKGSKSNAAKSTAGKGGVSRQASKAKLADREESGTPRPRSAKAQKADEVQAAGSAKAGAGHPVVDEGGKAPSPKAAKGEAEPGIYELGGPEVLTMRALARQVLDTIGRRRAILGMPGFLARPLAAVLDGVQMATGGLLTNRILTRDQLRSLKRPNRVGKGVKTFADLGIVPTAPSAVIGEYLWRFRPSGQYDAITATAKNLRGN